MFLDFDGTLVPIGKNPAECFLSDRIRKQLHLLAESGRICLTIMSGRSLSDVRKRVGARKIYYGGNHGFDVSGPGIRYTHEKALSVIPLLGHIKRLLRSRMRDVEGAWIEDKKFSLSLHFRAVKKEHIPLVKKAFFDIADESLSNGSLGLTRGKKVLELTPDPTWNKGRAVLLIMGLFKGDCLPVYVGDDLTDETAFKAINNKKGIAVCVGKSKRTAANFYLKGHREVSRLLQQILRLYGIEI